MEEAQRVLLASCRNHGSGFECRPYPLAWSSVHSVPSTSDHRLRRLSITAASTRKHPRQPQGRRIRRCPMHDEKTKLELTEPGTVRTEAAVSSPATDSDHASGMSLSYKAFLHLSQWQQRSKSPVYLFSVKTFYQRVVHRERWAT